MEFKYYYGSQADQFTFIRIPKVMLTEEMFSPLSLQSKVLYGLLLDRMSLSVKNSWFDKENRVYIIYQISEIMEDLGFSKKKAIDYLAELEKFGLVEKKRRGLGLPTILYVKSFIAETTRSNEIGTSINSGLKKAHDEEHKIQITGANKACYKPVIVQKAEADEEVCNRSVDSGTSRGVDLGTSRSVETVLQEVTDMKPLEVTISTPQNNTNINNTDYSYTESNHIESNQFGAMGIDEMNYYSRKIKQNIGYTCLLERYPYEHELINGIVDLMLETMLCQSESILIASNMYPAQLVKDKLMQIDFMHIEYVLGCFKENTTKVRNIKKYLLAALFNAPSTISGYYTAEVNHDMPQFARAR